MSEERRAHERMDVLESTLRHHLEEHQKFEKIIADNSKIIADNAKMVGENAAQIKQLVDNTKEIVDLVKGAKGFRSFILWVTPLVAALYALYVWVKS